MLCDKVQEVHFFSREEVPICKWHDRSFFRPSRPLPSANGFRVQRWQAIEEYVTEPIWVAEKRTFCAHEMRIVEWGVSTDTCECDSCGHFEVTCHVRISPYDDQPFSWEFSRNEMGRPCMEEKHIGCEAVPEL